MKKKQHNPIVLKPDTNIGNSSAEADDEFLFQCFFDHPALVALQDMESSKLFASGRTGSGKTAIIRMINKNNENVSEIDLNELALEYVANSDIIRFLNALDVDLDLFYQALWKHVFCIEYIRMKFSVEDENKSRNIFMSISDFFKRDPRKAAAIQYLKDWENKFWITMDENIKEITEGMEKSINAEFGSEIDKFRTRAGYARSLSREKKSMLVDRAKKVVNSKLLTDLAKVMDLLREYEQDKRNQRRHYILIDRLDEKWVDERIRYSLIRALIECLRSFRKFTDLKVIVSIRSDVLERVIQENNEAGFQREKYDDYFLRIRWSKDQLRELVEKRINYLFRRKYSSDNIFFSDIFDKKVGNKDSFDYICERTLMRPRDVISFVNLCLSHAQGRPNVNQSVIKSVESEYSRIRLQALIEEWQSAFPSISVAFKLLSGRGGRFKPSEIAGKEFIEEFILEVSDIEGIENDPIFQSAKEYMKSGNTSDMVNTARVLISTMYRIGAIGLKLASNEPYQYSHRNVPVIGVESITLDSKIYVHPMLHRALNVDASGR